VTAAEQPALLELRISAPDAAVAQALADLLVGERLAACAQLVPITSTYRWQGAIETQPEVLVLAKTTAARFDAICTRVRAEHPYDNPEIIAVPVVAATEPYAAWLADAVSED
jgi:periplasmic divalent cation tolerance protein